MIIIFIIITIIIIIFILSLKLLSSLLSLSLSYYPYYYNHYCFYFFIITIIIIIIICHKGMTNLKAMKNRPMILIGGWLAGPEGASPIPHSLNETTPSYSIQSAIQPCMDERNNNDTHENITNQALNLPFLYHSDISPSRLSNTGIMMTNKSLLGTRSSALTRYKLKESMLLLNKFDIGF